MDKTDGGYLRLNINIAVKLCTWEHTPRPQIHNMLCVHAESITSLFREQLHNRWQDLVYDIVYPDINKGSIYNCDVTQIPCGAVACGVASTFRLTVNLCFSFMNVYILTSTGGIIHRLICHWIRVMQRHL